MPLENRIRITSSHRIYIKIFELGIYSFVILKEEIIPYSYDTCVGFSYC
jgi:hypothetical protein